MPAKSEKTTYSQKLRSPKWQKKRLEILNRDCFFCQACGADEVTLHVHHTMYTPDTDPWDYPNESLITFCEPCHDATTRHKKELKAAIDKYCIYPGQLRRLLMFVKPLTSDVDAIDNLLTVLQHGRK